MGKFDGILILSDLDGTLLTNTVLSDENKRAIEYFQANGGLFTVATGRAPEFINKIDITPNAPIVAINGTAVIDEADGHLLKSYTMPDSSVEAAVYMIKNHNVVRISIFSYSEYKYPNPKPEDFAEFKEPVRKIVFVFKDEAETLCAKAALTKKYPSGYAFERSWSTGIEMRSENGGKGECLKLIKELTGSKTVIAAGDYENDITMLRAADISYAPSDANLAALEIADRIACPCAEHTIAQIIYELDEKISKGLDL